MSSTQTFVIALVTLGAGISLAVLGVVRQDSSILGLGTGFIGLVAGYTFRDKLDAK